MSIAKTATPEEAAPGELKKRFAGFASLLGSGAISAIGFTLIASQRWPLFDRHLAAFIILFVQWQVLGLTVAKVGVEQLVFAVVSGERNKVFAPRKFIATTVAPLAALFALAVAVVFSPWAALVAFGSILLDSYSLIVMAELNARGFYGAASVANLMNYPLFFALLFGLNAGGGLTPETALGAFLLSSLLRALWLSKRRSLPEGAEEFVSEMSLKMGVQQGLNFLLYRIDQIILAAMGLQAHFDQRVGMYVYMAKFPELIGSLMVVAGTVIFPKVYIRSPFTAGSLLSDFRRYLPLVPGYLLLLAALVWCYAGFWNGDPIPPGLAAPFLVNALLILLANCVTYSMLRQGALPRLIRNLLGGVAVGGILAILPMAKTDIFLLAWIVPLQLAVFLGISLRGRWGTEVQSHG